MLRNRHKNKPEATEDKSGVDDEDEDANNAERNEDESSDADDDDVEEDDDEQSENEDEDDNEAGSTDDSDDDHVMKSINRNQQMNENTRIGIHIYVWFPLLILQSFFSNLHLIHAIIEYISLIPFTGLKSGLSRNITDAKSCGVSGTDNKVSVFLKVFSLQNFQQLFLI